MFVVDALSLEYYYKCIPPRLTVGNARIGKIPKCFYTSRKLNGSLQFFPFLTLMVWKNVSSIRRNLCQHQGRRTTIPAVTGRLRSMRTIPPMAQNYSLSQLIVIPPLFEAIPSWHASSSYILHFPRAPFREHFSFPLPLYDHSNDLGPCCFSNPRTPQLSQLLSLQRYWALLRNLHATHMSSPWRYNAPRFELLATPTLRFNSLTRLFYILLLTLFLSPPMIDVAVEISYSSQQTKVD